MVQIGIDGIGGMIGGHIPDITTSTIRLKANFIIVMIYFSFTNKFV